MFQGFISFSTAIVGVENKQNPSMDGITNKRQNREKPKAFPDPLYLKIYMNLRVRMKRKGKRNLMLQKSRGKKELTRKLS